MDLARSVWIPAVAGWLVAASLIDCWDRARPWVPPMACAPDLGDWQEQTAGQWMLLLTERELRRVPGVGRTRGRQLARAAWVAGMDARLSGAQAWMEGLPGIGPVTAGAVADWAREHFPLWSRACVLGPRSACVAWRAWQLWPRWGPGASVWGPQVSLACVPAHKPLFQAVHFEPATWPNPPTTP